MHPTHAVHPSPRYLLILGCSGRKRANPELLPALDRYDGVNYRVLRKARSEGYWPPALDILILSAEYGLLRPDAPIPHYDRLTTHPRALEFRPAVARDLDAALGAGTPPYAEIFVNLGKTYRLALADSSALRRAPNVRYASGGIGAMMAQMKAWLHDIAKRQRDPAASAAPQASR